MVKIPYYRVNAFADNISSGNPAAVCMLEQWLYDEVMQAIAKENNLSETAFCVPCVNGFKLRWFTPGCEVDLCGHATLAAAHVLKHELEEPATELRFFTASGELRVSQRGAEYALSMPALGAAPCELPACVEQGLGVSVLESYDCGDDLLCVLPSADTIRGLNPDWQLLQQVDARGVIVTAEADTGADYVCRWFGSARTGIQEDPVTGSAHCALAPFWGQRLGKHCLEGRQLSDRGGRLRCELEGERVTLIGQAITFHSGYLHWPAR